MASLLPLSRLLERPWTAMFCSIALFCATAAGQSKPVGLESGYRALTEELAADPRPSIETRIRLLRKFIAAHPDQATHKLVLAARLSLAGAWLDAQRPIEAEKEFRSIVEVTADGRTELQSEATYGRARAYLLAQDDKNARQVLTAIVKDYPGTHAARCAKIALQHLDNKILLEIGSPIPELTLGRSTEGREVALPDDRPCLLVFFSRHHLASVKRMQSLLHTWQKAGMPIEDFIALPTEPASPALRRLVLQKHWLFPVLATAHPPYMHPAWVQLNVTSVPSSFLLGPRRTLLARDLPPDRLAETLR